MVLKITSFGGQFRNGGTMHCGGFEAVVLVWGAKLAGKREDVVKRSVLKVWMQTATRI